MELKDFNFWAVVAYVLPGLLMIQARSLAAKISITTVSDGEIRDCSCFLCQEN